MIPLSRIYKLCTLCESCGEQFHWNSLLDGSGRPVISFEGKRQPVRRGVYPKPLVKGMVVITTCKNPLCVNPALLRQISRRTLRTSHSRQEFPTAVKLKIGAANRKVPIDVALDTSVTAKEIAEKFNVDVSSVYRIRRQFSFNPFKGLLR